MMNGIIKKTPQCFQESLKQRLEGNLPGAKAHAALAPADRISSLYARDAEKKARLSSVLIHIFLKQDLYYIVFIRRQIDGGVHSGQISFPGGKKEDSDLDFCATAIREAEEEIGIKANEINILGKLSSLYIPPSNFLVHPFVSFSEKESHFKAEPAEVRDIIQIPLSFFLQANAKQQTEVFRKNSHAYKAPAFIFNDVIIWGATAMILNELIELLQN